MGAHRMTKEESTVLTSSPRILILGAAGQLGRALRRSFAGIGSIIAADRTLVDIADGPRLREFVRGTQPAVILNAAAYTAVDRAESEPEQARAINTACPGILAEEAKALNALLVHYSTDYVFDGSKSGPWTEDDATNPLSVYGSSKLAGERAIQAVGVRYLIFRTSWVYGPQGNNFLFTMLRLAGQRDKLSIVNDQIGAPTTSIELADATRAIVEGILADRFGATEDWAGIYHMTCAGSTSWFGFAQAIFAHAEQLGVKPPELLPISTEDYPTPARRPRNSVLSNEKINLRFGVELASWQAALDAVSKQIRISRSHAPRDTQV